MNAVGKRSGFIAREREWGRWWTWGPFLLAGVLASACARGSSAEAPATAISVQGQKSAAAIGGLNPVSRARNISETARPPPAESPAITIGPGFAARSAL